MTNIKRFFTVIIICLLAATSINLYQTNPELRHNIQQFITQPAIKSQKKKSPAHQTKPFAQRDPDTSLIDSRWPQNRATIYLNVHNQVLHDATEIAIKKWNKTGVFTFHKTSNPNANIVVSEMDDTKTPAAGLTCVNMNQSTGYLLFAKVLLNKADLLDPNLPHAQMLNIIEHELGHAIGLQHTNAVSVMQPVGGNYPIQKLDIENVKRLYTHQPKHKKQSSNQNTQVTHK